MAAVQRKLVHKQFNSPMGLYSQENVKATLNRELKAFGADGIEIDDQITKPLNLANSAVLRAVEEEEQQVKCGYKRVAWPPASEERIVREFTPQPQMQSPAPGTGGYYPQSAATAPTAPVPSHQPSNAAAPQQQQQQQQQQPHQQQYQPSYQQQQHQPTHPPHNVGGGWKHIGAPAPKAHNDFTAGGVAPATNAYPNYQQQQQPQQQYPQQQQQHQQHQQYQQQPQQQQYRAPSNDSHQQQQQQWQQQQQQQQPQQQLPPQMQQYQAPYQTSPYQPQQQQQQPSYPQQNGGANYAQPQYNSYSQPQQQPQQQQQLHQQQQQQLPYSQDQTDQQQGYRGASPGIITLRKEAPVSQTPQPVYTSQPAAVSYQGGSKLRGDLKWPPPEYKEAAVKENEERRLLALGPVCRPRRVNRDYTTFFARHQLNNGYPSYKVPPGTQHMFG
ncbi:putative cyclin-dependent serine/threonine-protein kinase DDB_G0272797/DDB_G0274007 isoform X10 [Drosophila grimshawi]|uniref:putative cyclin-dependent serine/threonine-protein kinase DDB_G0272797/DDB_G0274007 isoform X10 n=1 Tax=Drosophila grimshawi TaxID=7222 RepID=UPI0013EF2472|nr:putative cyclin-dependent serine/threonine-protein kinase DDB_G0272797/DDB_G0274007 isoform X10 [Drosophila grimshawi]